MNFLTNLLDSKNTGSSVAAGLSSVNQQMSGWAGQIKAIAGTIFGLLTIAMIGLACFLAFKMFTASDEGKRKNAKGQLIYAIIGVVVMLVMLLLSQVITDAVNGML